MLMQVPEVKSAAQIEQPHLPERLPARPATPPPQLPTAKPAAASALSPASSGDFEVDVRYSLDDDVDDSAADVQPTVTAAAAEQVPLIPETASAPLAAVQQGAPVVAPAVDVDMWLRSLGLLLNQCPWHEAAAAEGAAARQSLLRPLLSLLGQLMTAASAGMQVDSTVTTVAQVTDWPSPEVAYLSI